MKYKNCSFPLHLALITGTVKQLGLLKKRWRGIHQTGAGKGGGEGLVRINWCFTH